MSNEDGVLIFPWVGTWIYILCGAQLQDMLKICWLQELLMFVSLRDWCFSAASTSVDAIGNYMFMIDTLGHAELTSTQNRIVSYPSVYQEYWCSPFDRRWLSDAILQHLLGLLLC